MATKPQALLSIEENRRSRLRELIKDRFMGSSIAFARATGISQAQVSMLLRDPDRPFGESKARSIEDALDLPWGYLDQRDATNIGFIEMLNEDKKRFVIDSEWLKQKYPTNINLKDFAAVLAVGDSMAPTISSGDMVLVDRALNSVNIDGVYLFTASNNLMLKRISQDTMGRYIVSSDNPMIKQISYLDDEVQIIGKVVYILNIKSI